MWATFSSDCGTGGIAVLRWTLSRILVVQTVMASLKFPKSISTGNKVTAGITVNTCLAVETELTPCKSFSNERVLTAYL